MTRINVREVHETYTICPYSDCAASVPPDNLSQHVESSHENVKLECENCGGSFSFWVMSNHRLTCIGDSIRLSPIDIEHQIVQVEIDEPTSDPAPPEESPEIIPKPKTRSETCKNCGTTVSFKYIKEHMARCSAAGSRNFHCTVDACKSSFVTQFSLKMHMENVHGARIKCPEKDCGLFLKRKCLQGHLRNVHQKQTRKCEKCEKEFSVRAIKDHIDRCTSNGERKFHCFREGCDWAFTTEANREAHLKRAHKPREKCPHKHCGILLKPSTMAKHLKNKHSTDKQLKPQT